MKKFIFILFFMAFGMQLCADDGFVLEEAADDGFVLEEAVGSVRDLRQWVAHLRFVESRKFSDILEQKQAEYAPQVLSLIESAHASVGATYADLFNHMQYHQIVLRFVEQIIIFAENEELGDVLILSELYQGDMVTFNIPRELILNAVMSCGKLFSLCKGVPFSLFVRQEPTLVRVMNCLHRLRLIPRATVSLEHAIRDYYSIFYVLSEILSEAGSSELYSNIIVPRLLADIRSFWAELQGQIEVPHEALRWFAMLIEPFVVGVGTLASEDAAILSDTIELLDEVSAALFISGEVHAKIAGFRAWLQAKLAVLPVA